MSHRFFRRSSRSDGDEFRSGGLRPNDRAHPQTVRKLLSFANRILIDESVDVGVPSAVSIPSYRSVRRSLEADATGDFERTVPSGDRFFRSPALASSMRDEEEIREQYEFLTEHLESEDMRHEGVRQMFTHYKRAIGWVLEEEHI